MLLLKRLNPSSKCWIFSLNIGKQSDLTSKGKIVFVNLPTGFGKSLIFQCLLIVVDIVHKKPWGSSIVVISPLRSLMED